MQIPLATLSPTYNSPIANMLPDLFGQLDLEIIHTFVASYVVVFYDINHGVFRQAPYALSYMAAIAINHGFPVAECITTLQIVLTFAAEI